MEKFVAQQKELLALEREAEVEEATELLQNVPVRELCQRGVALQKLWVAGTRTGLYGRTLVTFSNRDGSEFPAHTLSSGDILGVRSQGGDSLKVIASGVVVEVKSNSVSVAFDDSGETGDLEADSASQLYCLTKLANDVTYRRLLKALDRIQSMETSLLANILLGTSQPSIPYQSLPPRVLASSGTIAFLNTGLDTSQQEAVDFALKQRELGIIHGPPGTGKTTTVVEIIWQAVAAGEKVLVCAPSNVAVDNLLERLVRVKLRCIRLGHPARVTGDLQKHSLEALISSSDQSQIVRDIYKEIDELVGKGKRKGGGRGGGGGERSKVWQEVKQLRKELRVRENKVMKEILGAADVILGTLTSSGQDSPLKHLPDQHFSVCVIDECSQSLEMACWMAVPWAKKLILAGDHLQLPPTILSTKAAKGLELTLMERLIKETGESVVRMLTTQYRMNTHIMKWSSDALYGGRVTAGESVADHKLCHLPSVVQSELTETVLLLIDTAGCDMAEFTTADGISKGNEGEAAILCNHVRRLVESGVDPTEIAVITPYNLQVDLIRLNLRATFPRVEVRSVDGYQGREKEAVVLSLVRSNPAREVGFLAERRRLNVAVTRARRQVAVVCDSETVGKDKFLKEFLDYLEEHGTIESAQIYSELPAVTRPQDNTFSSIVESKKETKSDGQSASSKKDVPSKSGKKESKKPSVKEVSKTVVSCHQETQERRKHFPGEKTEPPPTAPDLEAELRAKIDTFLNSDSAVHSFSSELTANERRIVHEIAESIGLSHESQGEGKNRHIVLGRSVAGASAVNCSSSSSSCNLPLAPTLSTVEEVKPVSSRPEVVCSICCKSVPKTNIELHKLRCSVQRVEGGGTSVNPTTSTTTTTSTLSKQKKKTAKLKTAGENTDDFDALCDQFQALKKVCNYDKCKTKVTTLGVNCEFCPGRFCLSHSMAEIHGCGDAAKTAARQQIHRDKKLYPGSGTVASTLDPTKRVHLARKLDKKITTLSSGRKQKKPEK